jgi:hypothetical protein
MKRSLLLAAVALACLAGCAKKSDGPAVTLQNAPAAANAAAGGAAPAVSAPALAYRYDYRLQAPAKAVPGLMTAHEKACAAAGPSVCQMVGQETHAEGRDDVSGSLTLRATAGWMATFREGITGQAKAAGGKVIADQVDSEDLTHQIVDVGAQIRAKTALRDRLQGLIASRPGKLSDLIDVENELARVQGEIDSAQSELAVMSGRVAMSEVKIAYTSSGVWAPEGTWAPLGQAGRESMSLMVFALSLLIRIAAFTTPFIVPFAAIMWFVRRRPRANAADGPPKAA